MFREGCPSTNRASQPALAHDDRPLQSWITESGRCAKAKAATNSIPGACLQRRGGHTKWQTEIGPKRSKCITIKRLCRSTLQAETYGMQSAVEAGDRLRAIICEVKGLIPDVKDWFEASQRNMRHLWVTDCRSLSDHLNTSQPLRRRNGF